MASSRMIELLEALADARVEFVVIGGIAAVLHGAPIVTRDVDIVHRTTPENVARNRRRPAAVARARPRRRPRPFRRPSRRCSAAGTSCSTPTGVLSICSVRSARDRTTRGSCRGLR